MHLYVISFAAFLAWTTSILPVASAGEQDDPRVIRLGGLRKASAVISVDEIEYTIVAKMTPVKIFDDASNSSIDRRLLIRIALRALTKCLAEKPVTLTAIGTATENFKTDKNVCRLTIRLPIKGVKIQPSQVSVNPVSQHCSGGMDVLGSNRQWRTSRQRVTARADLLSRKQEYATLIDVLANALETRIDTLQVMQSGEHEVDYKAETVSVSNQVSDNLRALSAAVQQDLMLLSAEKAELLKELRSREQRLLQKLRDATTAAAVKSQPQEINHHANDSAALPDRVPVER